MGDSKHSFKDYLCRSFTDLPADEFSNQEIIKSCFAQINPETLVFPDGVENLTLSYCDLTNVLLPAGATIGEGCQVQSVKVQNDGNDWVLGPDKKPVEPVNKKFLESQGKSVDPADIPLVDVLKKG